MNVKTTIQFGAIEQAQRILESMPEFKSETLSKAQAVQMLIWHIRAAQSKGYNLQAIGKVLSDCGISIPIGSLRAYVSEASANGRRKSRGRARPAGSPQRGTKKGAAAKTDHGAAPVEPAAVASRPGGVSAAGHVDLDLESSSKSEKGPAAPGAFYVRPDRKTI